MEEWRDITGYEGLYKISNLGRIKSLHRNYGDKTLRPAKNRFGYLRLSLMKDGVRKNVNIARLVLQAFAGEPSPGMEAAHLDGNRADNRLSNLKWVTGSENQYHKIIHGTMALGERHGMCKYPQEKVDSARKHYRNGMSVKQIRRILGASPSWVGLVVRNKSRVAVNHTKEAGIA